MIHVLITFGEALGMLAVFATIILASVALIVTGAENDRPWRVVAGIASILALAAAIITILSALRGSA